MITADFLKEKMEAMKARDHLKKNVLTNLLSSLSYAEKDLGRPLSSEEVQQQVARERKKLQEAYNMAEGRPDAQEGLQKEIVILSGYLPEELGDNELKNRIEEVLSEGGVERTMQQKGIAMQIALQAVSGQADGKRISDAVDHYLKAE